MHHGYTNVLGLGDSSTWRLPLLNRYVYMFLAPLLIPVLTPLVALGECHALILPAVLPLLASVIVQSGGQLLKNEGRIPGRVEFGSSLALFLPFWLVLHPACASVSQLAFQGSWIDARGRGSGG